MLAALTLRRVGRHSTQRILSLFAKQPHSQRYVQAFSSSVEEDELVDELLGGQDEFEVYDDPESVVESLRAAAVDYGTMEISSAHETNKEYLQRAAAREQLLRDQLTSNLPPQFGKLRGHVAPPAETFDSSGRSQLRGRERELYELHLQDPEKWDIAALGEKFRISQVRAQAVIMLQRLHEERLGRGDYYTHPLYDAMNSDIEEYYPDMSEYGVKPGEPGAEAEATSEEVEEEEEEEEEEKEQPVLEESESDAQEEGKPQELPGYRHLRLEADMQATLSGEDRDEIFARLVDKARKAGNDGTKSDVMNLDDWYASQWIRKGERHWNTFSKPNEEPDAREARVRQMRKYWSQMARDIEAEVREDLENEEYIINRDYSFPTDEAHAFFQKEGYFRQSVVTRERSRVDLRGRKGRKPRSTHFMTDEETIEDVKKMWHLAASKEKPTVPPKPFADKPHEVRLTKNLRQDARYKRKVVFEDISGGQKEPSVRILDHDGVMREPADEELLHRHSIFNGGRKK